MFLLNHMPVYLWIYAIYECEFGPAHCMIAD